MMSDKTVLQFHQCVSLYSLTTAVFSWQRTVYTCNYAQSRLFDSPNNVLYTCMRCVQQIATHTMLVILSWRPCAFVSVSVVWGICDYCTTLYFLCNATFTCFFSNQLMRTGKVTSISLNTRPHSVKSASENHFNEITWINIICSLCLRQLQSLSLCECECV